MYVEGKKSFLEKLQSADEATKQRWLIGLSAVIMAVIVFLWLGYFNSLIVGTASDVQLSAQQNGASGTGLTFFETMKNGLSILYRGFIGELHAFGRILAEPREYIVKPPQ